MQRQESISVQQYGEEYVSAAVETVKKDAEDPGCARGNPSDGYYTVLPAMVKESLSRDQFRLYQLIWKRFAASRMAPAVYETTSVKIGAGEYRFTLSASKIVFDGFMSVYTQEEDKTDRAMF